MVNVNGFEIKKLKTMDGLDGRILSGKLYLCKKEVCDFFDEGVGGGMYFPYIANTQLFEFAKEKVAEIYAANNATNNSKNKLEVFIRHLIGLETVVKDSKKMAKRNNSSSFYLGVAVEKEEIGSFFVWEDFSPVGSLEPIALETYLDLCKESKHKRTPQSIVINKQFDVSTRKITLCY